MRFTNLTRMTSNALPCCPVHSFPACWACANFDGMTFTAPRTNYRLAFSLPGSAGNFIKFIKRQKLHTLRTAFQSIFPFTMMMSKMVVDVHDFEIFESIIELVSVFVVQYHSFEALTSMTPSFLWNWTMRLLPKITMFRHEPVILPYPFINANVTAAVFALIERVAMSAQSLKVHSTQLSGLDGFETIGD